MAKVLVVDDDKNIRKLIAAFLGQKGYAAVCAENGDEALGLLENTYFDAMIVDVMMPRVDGCELTEDVRSVDGRIPILMITAKESFEDKERGFTAGADDYMTKPINLDEMNLRLAALLRRAKISVEQKIILGDLCINADTRMIETPEGAMELPRREFELLFKLLSQPQKTFTRRQLMDEIWGMDSEADERTIDVHIKRIREKLESRNEFEIITVRGLGYRAERRI